MKRGGTQLCLAALASLTFAACASAPPVPPPAPLAPYTFAPPPRSESKPSVPRAPETLLAPPSPATASSPQIRLDAELIRFAAAQREARALVHIGEPMPEDVRDAWATLLAHVDHFLRQKPEQTVPLDVVRARVALDAELDLDTARYSELPQGLAPSIHARTLALAQRMAEVRKLAAPARPTEAALAWPIEPAVVTSLYGVRIDPFTRTRREHLGIDLHARKGQLIQAAAAGVVMRAERAGGYGLHVEVLHEDGTVTTYSHMSRLLVTTGLRVPVGGPIGLAGSTGRSTGPHLHFEVWRDGRSIDPLIELGTPDDQDLDDEQSIGDGK